MGRRPMGLTTSDWPCGYGPMGRWDRCDSEARPCGLPWLGFGISLVDTVCADRKDGSTCSAYQSV